MTTDEAAPEAPVNARILAATTTQLKVGWDPPLNSNGVLKGYYVYNGERLLRLQRYVITAFATMSVYSVTMSTAASSYGALRQQRGCWSTILMYMYMYMYM